MRSQISILHKQETRINRGNDMKMEEDRICAVYASTDYLLNILFPQFEDFERHHNLAISNLIEKILREKVMFWNSFCGQEI